MEGKSKLSSRGDGRGGENAQKNNMKARNQIQSQWLYLRPKGLGEGERWGRHRSSGSVWKAGASVRGLLLRPAIHFTSTDTNRHKTARRRRGRATLAIQERRWGEGREEGWKGTGYVEWPQRLFWQQRGSGGWRMPSFLTPPDVLPSNFTQCGNQYPLFSPLGFPINR